VELQGRIDDLTRQGLGVAVISYDPPEILAAFARAQRISFPLLSDSGSATIRSYGILNPLPELALAGNADDPALKAELQRFVSPGTPAKLMAGMAFPGTFVVDRQGRVTSRFFEEYYVERNTVASVMMKLGTGGAPVNVLKLSTPHLDAAAFPSDGEVAVGNRFTIALDVTPKPGIHVYAPGAAEYRVITLAIAEQPAIRVLPIQYPPSEVYVFAPLNERVAVYQKPFRLLREIVVEGTPPAQAALRGQTALTIGGTLEYQACDDKVCFNPVALPVSWTLSLRPLVTARPR
jgi:AhpC/TSA family/Thiol:disulfide interchange protein DsbD, N-terminal